MRYDIREAQLALISKALYINTGRGPSYNFQTSIPISQTELSHSSLALRLVSTSFPI